jgi:hypothetical protein
VVGSPIEVIEHHSNRSMSHTNGERVHNEWALAVLPVVVDTGNNAKVLGPLQTEGCKAEQRTCERSAYPCMADFDSS